MRNQVNFNDVANSQALESYIERKPDLKELVSNCNAERLVDSAAATKLINDFVSVLIDLRG